MSRVARLFLFLSLCIVALSISCADEEEAELGEPCGGHAKDPVGCVSDLFCCQPDPRIFDIPGTCVEPADRSEVGEACGATTSACCADGAWCSVWDQDAGDGTCIAEVN